MHILPRRTVIFLGFVALLVCSCSNIKRISEPLEEKETDTVGNCEAGREYVTSHEFMRKSGNVKITDKEANDIAIKVSAGCTDAAKRFITVVLLLRKAGFGMKDALNVGVDAAKTTNMITDTFVNVFRLSFKRKGLDLALAEALSVARAVSIDYKGDPEVAEDDFMDMIEFCSSFKGLDLSKPKCATLAKNVTIAGEDYDGSSAKAFENGFEFLTDADGAHLTTVDALQVAEELIKIGPKAIENFRAAFEYANEKSGLGLGRKESVIMAKKVAYNTKVKVPKSM